MALENFKKGQSMSSEEIKALRLSRGETQAQFAQSLGTTVTTVTRWETNKSSPSPIFIKLMAGLK